MNTRLEEDDCIATTFGYLRSCNLCNMSNLATNPVLGPSLNGLVTDGNTKLWCQSFLSALFQSTTANKIDFEHAQYYKMLLTLCEAEISQVTVKRIGVF